MSITNARTFVARLKENYDFRNKALATSGTEELVAFLRSEDLTFTQRELVGAMAECMEQQELQTETDHWQKNCADLLISVCSEDPTRCLLVTGFPYDIRDSERNNLDNFVRFMKITEGVGRLGSAAIDLCYVAAGRFIAAEAGAKVTTVLGENDCLIPPCSVIAAPPVIHAGILAELV